ncbi:putative O-glycosylation ligase, exosortase A system-associated [Salinisphaera sp. SPP-AMP-43]|uniref:putative O-glycosylation ligase, exosortase A system-associated n=1 Tax=Salinisphaera sp. SPP-AMP-43 TaxID=3121288 RepID=UPI003C6E478C
MRDIALLLFVVATLPMAFMRPIIGLLLWMMFSYLNPHRMTWGFAVTQPWVMIVAIVTLAGLAAQAKQRQAPPFKPIVVLMTLFLGWVALSTTQAVVPEGANKELTQFIKMMTMTYVTLMLVTDRQKLQWVIWVSVASFGFWGFKGGLFTLLTGGNYHVMGPESSFFTDNNQFALIMCMTIPLMRYVQLHTEDRRLNIVLWAVMGLTAVAVIGTYSRGGLLALAITGGMLIWKSRRRSILILLAPALALAIGAFMPEQYANRINTIDQYQQDKSAQGRIQSWEFAFNVAKANPLFGGGFNVWSSHDMWRQYGPPDAVPGRAIHSIFFEVLGEQGFVGLALFIALMAAGYIGLARIRKKARAGPPENAFFGDLASMLQVSLVAYAAAGSLLPMPYIDFLYQMLAIVAVMQVLVERQPAKARQHSGPSSIEPKKDTPGSSAGKRQRSSRARPRKELASGGGERVRGIQDLPPW